MENLNTSEFLFVIIKTVKYVVDVYKNEEYFKRSTLS